MTPSLVINAYDAFTLRCDGGGGERGGGGGEEDKKQFTLRKRRIYAKYFYLP